MGWPPRRGRGRCGSARWGPERGGGAAGGPRGARGGGAPRPRGAPRGGPPGGPPPPPPGGGGGRGAAAAALPPRRVPPRVARGVVGLVHYRLGERHHAVSCYRQALVLANQSKTPLARRWLVSLLAEFGDACAAVSDLPAAAGAWQQALQILDDLGLEDSLG